MAESGRFHSLDALRATALLLGIALHSTQSFWPGFREANWPITDDSSSLTLSALFFVAHIFRMSVFYAIAGFFAHLLLVKLGAWGLVRNRLRRIALPFVVSYVVVMPLLIVPFIWAMKVTGITARPNMAPPFPDPQMPPWGHLWFLYLLLVMYVLWLGARTLLLAVDRSGATPRLVDRVLAAIVTSRVGPVLLAAPAAVVLYYTSWWIMWPGIPTPIMGLIPNFPALLAYGSAFAFGWFLHRQTGLLDVLKRDWATYIVIALALSALSLWIVGARPQLSLHELPTMQRAVYSAAYNIAGWYWVFGLIGAAVRFLDRPSAFWRYLADASFFVYIIHLPIVYALQTWMIRWPLHWSMKYALIVALTTVIVFAMYHFLVRSTFVGKFINGRKYPKRGTDPLLKPQLER
jgi:peptidoglycan/LPS O-acetylase OafA/YrhL